MATSNVYIVDFNDVMYKFRKVISDPEMPTIDADMVKYSVMGMFMQVNPLGYLDRLAYELTKDDSLYGKDDFLYETNESLALTQEEANEQDKFVRDYLREALVDLGKAMYQHLANVGLLRTGLERYEVINRPITDDTYILKPTRP